MLQSIKHVISKPLAIWIHFWNYFLSDIISIIPCWALRKYCYRISGFKIGKRTTINMHTVVKAPSKISVGSKSHINRNCILDGRGGVTICNNVSISCNVCIISGGHKINSPSFEGEHLPIIINDNVFIGVNATILKNVNIGKGAVVCAGSVVTKDVAPYSIVGGVPAKHISQRNTDLYYDCDNSGIYFL